MKYLFPLILITSTLFGQDVLVTVSGARANIKFIELTETHVVFKKEGSTVINKLPLRAVYQIIKENGDILDIGNTVSEQAKVQVEKNKLLEEENRIKLLLHGNKTSKHYHLGTVNHLPLELNRKLFSSENEAKSEGYKPCAACFDLRPRITDYYFEKQISVATNSAIRNSNEILYEHPDLPRMQTRLDRLLNQWTETLKGYDYRILIIKEKDPNAFAVAGGNIYVTTGLIEMIEDDSELDFIIAHEIAHIERRHSLREIKEAQKRAAIASIASLAVGVGVLATGGDANDAAIVTQLSVIFGDYANQFARKGFSREMEQESDIFAQLQLTQMGLTKEKMVYALDKLATHSTKLEIPLNANAFSDHPGLNARINQIMNSDIISLENPKNIYIMDNKISRTNMDKAIIKISTKFIYKGPSSNKKDEDIITLIGDIVNKDENNSYQIDKLDFKSYNAQRPITTSLKELAILASSSMDFATTINLKKKTSDEVFELIKSGKMSVSTKVSKVNIKPGEGVKKSWNNQPLQVSASFK